MRLFRYALIVFASFALNASAQYNEVGLVIGPSGYKGELREHMIQSTGNNLSGGLFFRHNWNRHWSWKLAVNYGRVSGDDSWSDYAFNLDRNLSFFSNVFDISPLIEFNFLPYETGNAYYPFTPYLFTGLSVFHFNPKAELGRSTYELQPLTTEGQRPYRRWQLAVPIGGGIKCTVGRLGIGLEFGARRAYADYLDDVSTQYPNLYQLQADKGSVAVSLSDRSYYSQDSSQVFNASYLKQRGNPQDKDWYFFGGVTLYYRLSSLLKDICKPFKHRRYV